MTILVAASEMVPFCKTGGLADVIGSLTPVLARLGHDVRVILPGHRSIDRLKFGFQKHDESFTAPVGDRHVSYGISSTTWNGVDIYLIENDAYFGRAGLYGDASGDYPDNGERFSFYSRAVLETATFLRIRPDIINAHDWQAGLVIAYLRTLYGDDPFFENTGALFTIHNLGYQGIFPHDVFSLTGIPEEEYSWRKLEYFGNMSFIKGGIVYADAVSTVSRTYAEEITQPELCFGLDGVFKERLNDLYGIVNGIDYGEWNPAVDRAIAARFDTDNLSGKKKCRSDVLKLYGLRAGGTVPVIGMVSRLDDQKGFDILEAAMEQLVSFDIRLIILGTGTKSHEDAVRSLAGRFPDAVGALLKFDNITAHKVYAGVDAFLMPSRYEPCGLGQLIAMRYGALPVVHATGGLVDTVVDMDDHPAEGTGFVFLEYTPDSLVAAVMRAVAMFRRKDRMRWTQAVHRAMTREFSWEKAAQEYGSLYEQIRNRRNG